MKKLFKEYRVELFSVILILIGIFLVFENLTIRAKLLAALRKAINAIQGIAKQVLEGIGNRLSILTASDILGILLILLAVGFIIWRVRYRFQTSGRWSIDYCPKCASPIMRVHRNWRDRLLGVTFLPEARRYRCTQPQCGWSGLLRRHVHRQRHRSKQISESQNT